MRTFNIYKAQGYTEKEPVENTTISIVQEVPEMRDLKEAGQIYEKEGAMLAEALRASLPGGTIDALLRELLISRASLLRVPMFEK
jgi:hypothetical protein